MKQRKDRRQYNFNIRLSGRCLEMIAMGQAAYLLEGRELSWNRSVNILIAGFLKVENHDPSRAGGRLGLMNRVDVEFRSKALLGKGDETVKLESKKKIVRLDDELWEPLNKAKATMLVHLDMENVTLAYVLRAIIHFACGDKLPLPNVPKNSGSLFRRIYNADIAAAETQKDFFEELRVTRLRHLLKQKKEFNPWKNQ